MTATRQNQKFQIYQDVNSSQSMPHNLIKPRPSLQPSAMPLQPVGNPRQYHNAPVQPSMSVGQQHMSPLKSQQISPPVQVYQQLNYIQLQAPTDINIYTRSPVKHTQMYPVPQFHQVPLSSQPMFTTFNSNLEAFPQENFHVMSVPQAETVDFPVPSYPRRQQLKRSMSEATALNDRPIKRLKEEEDTATLPDPQEMPSVEDDGNKPGYSYAQMIGMAILRAPNRRLTLSQIYDWISNTFVFYRDDPKQGWHNSIRHNLSLNKAFKKQERPKGDAGKGSYWIIEPGMEVQFFREKARKSSNIAGMSVHQHGLRSDLQVMAQPLAEAMTPSWSVQVPQPLPPRPQTAPALPELSSDATLPASDPALNEEDADEDGGDANLPSTLLPSSPLPIMNSSPPVVAGVHHRTISSPAHIRSNPGRQHKRSVTTVQDSGYFSELPSSVRRPKTSGVILTSEIDRPQKKQGRAEDEILRMRSSPHVTPNARRFSSAASDIGLLSSPDRSTSNGGINPMTPAIHFKKPLQKPPPSVSPNTQLQRHRLMMQDFTDSPVKGAGLAHDSLPDFSPQFKMPLSAYRPSFEEAFAIFDEDLLSRTPKTPGLASSPLRSLKRPSLSRSVTGSGVLRDTTNTNRLNSKTPSKQPTLKPPFQPKRYGGSPLKKSIAQTSDDFYDNANFNEFNCFDDENTFVNFEDVDEGETLVNEENSSPVDGEDGGTFDLAKGFANIGQSQPEKSNMMPPMKRQRPMLGRSLTSTF